MSAGGPAPTFCPKPGCGARLVVRSSKNGKFVCCPKSYKGNNHGTWAFAPERPDPDPRLPKSGLKYPHVTPDPEPDPDWAMTSRVRRFQPRQHETLAELVEFEAGLMSDPDLRFLQATAGVAAELAALRGGPSTGRDVFLDPLGSADYAIASAIHDGQYDDELDDPLSGCRMVGMPLF